MTQDDRIYSQIEKTAVARNLVIAMARLLVISPDDDGLRFRLAEALTVEGLHTSRLHNLIRDLNAGRTP